MLRSRPNEPLIASAMAIKMLMFRAALALLVLSLPSIAAVWSAIRSLRSAGKTS